MDIKKILLAEFIGTFILVFTATGAIVFDSMTNGTITHIGVSLVFGVVVMVVIYAIGDISGAHINPAVTIGLAISGEFPANRIAPYILFQCLGATAASFTLLLLFGNHGEMGATIPIEINDQRLTYECLILEVILTFILMFVVLNVAINSPNKKTVAGLIIGGIIAVEACFAGPISGASMNPARSLGPALASGNFTDFWIYIVGTISGAALAVPFWKYLVSNNIEQGKSHRNKPRRNKPRNRQPQRQEKQQWKKRGSNQQF